MHLPPMPSGISRVHQSSNDRLAGWFPLDLRAREGSMELPDTKLHVISPVTYVLRSTVVLCSIQLQRGLSSPDICVASCWILIESTLCLLLLSVGECPLSPHVSAAVTSLNVGETESLALPSNRNLAGVGIIHSINRCSSSGKLDVF